MSVLHFGEIRLPAYNVDLSKFATIACDQFTSDKTYWRVLAEYIGDSPSSLHLTCPEIYLSDNYDVRVKAISQNMRDYLDGNVFAAREYPAMLVDRTVGRHPHRIGLVVSVDLDAYSVDGATPIRATEGVVEHRLPPRIQLRENSVLELPHIILLCDDSDKTLVEKAYGERARLVYDFDMNMDGGRIRGYVARNKARIAAAADRLMELSCKKYGKPFLFAVGDGNHSLAAAKAVHDKNPNDEGLRYALTEIINIHSSGIEFLPIHRAVKVRDCADFMRYMKDKTSSLPTESESYCETGRESFRLPSDACDGVELTDKLISEYDTQEVDYIHGEDTLTDPPRGYVALRMFAPKKETFFETIARRGKLPKKTFSIGEAKEKRYYLEMRQIKEYRSPGLLDRYVDAFRDI